MTDHDIALDPLAGTGAVVHFPDTDARAGVCSGTILAVDPGTTESGWCVMQAGRVLSSGVQANDDMLATIRRREHRLLAVEMIASYGMPVGREVFETCVWIGRFVEAWADLSLVRLVYRREVKLHLCGTAQAKDANVRQAIIDLFPATGGGKVRQIGTKAQPGPLYGVSSHAWPAIGVALTMEARERAWLEKYATVAQESTPC